MGEHLFKLPAFLELANTDPFAAWFVVAGDVTPDGIRVVRSVLGVISFLPWLQGGDARILLLILFADAIVGEHSKDLSGLSPHMPPTLHFDLCIVSGCGRALQGTLRSTSNPLIKIQLKHHCVVY